MLLKRSGRGHEVEGVDGTGPGQCAVECPACPHPGRNMPSDLKDIPACDLYVLLLSSLLSLIFVRWKYRLILTIDANFRLKNKDRNTKDTPALGDGWAHFVPEAEYMEHVRKWGHEEEVRVVPFTLSGHIHLLLA